MASKYRLAVTELSLRCPLMIRRLPTIAAATRNSWLPFSIARYLSYSPKKCPVMEHRQVTMFCTTSCFSFTVLPVDESLRHSGIADQPAAAAAASEMCATDHKNNDDRQCHRSRRILSQLNGNSNFITELHSVTVQTSCSALLMVSGISQQMASS